MIFDTTSRVPDYHVWPYLNGAKGDVEVFTTARSMPFRRRMGPITIESHLSPIPAPGLIGRSLAALAVLAFIGPAALQAQIGLASGAARIALIARVPPRASINGVSSARETARRGNVREETVTVRLSANTGYRLLVVGTAQVGSEAGTASRLWVRTESGRFEEVESGNAVTVIRGRHGVAEWEPEVTFRSERSDSVEGPRVIPVRYEVRIDPTI